MSWSPVPKAQTLDEETLADRFSRGFEPVTGGDWVLLALAAIDILLLVARDVYAEFLPGIVETAIIAVDLGILAIFAIEFLLEAKQASNRLAYVRNHWYEVVGMIPIAHWGVRIFRLVRMLRIYVVKRYPLEEAPERDWSYALVRGLIMHYKSVLVEEITDPIVVTSIDMLHGPMTRARWAGAVGDSLEDHRENIHIIVEDNLEQDRRLASMLRTRTGQRIVHQVTDATLDSVIHTLESDELNEVIGESVGEILEELKERVKEKEYRQAGDSRLHPSLES
jgi:hypothetical protein